MSEFSLIARYFTRPTPSAVLGVGDDAALLRVAPGMELAVSTDMLVSGTHFFPDAEPFLLGHKTLAVNLSDLAAMGAVPRWATLALSLPGEDEAWLRAFSSGFFALAESHGVELIGGDTTRGPLNLSVTIMGEVPSGTALRRDGAKPCDDIWVSGALGDAALALAHLQGRVTLDAAQFAACAPALHQPQPRLALGQALRGLASAAIDISDGLLADLGHILERSQVGAEIEFAALPSSAVLRSLPTRDGEAAGSLVASLTPAPSPGGSGELRARCILAGGDDYELCFTAPQARRAEVEQLAQRLTLPLSRIGVIKSAPGCVVCAAEGGEIRLEASGYDHFA
ncbi:MAG: thiamine-phosphate kinase [Nitrosomonadales bacterium]|nr:thiamine-phosphate kinase [Nitrosomonadales bacterium]